jgi:hypothetical protein
MLDATQAVINSQVGISSLSAGWHPSKTHLKHSRFDRSGHFPAIRALTSGQSGWGGPPRCPPEPDSALFPGMAAATPMMTARRKINFILVSAIEIQYWVSLNFWLNKVWMLKIIVCCLFNTWWSLRAEWFF